MRIRSIKPEFYTSEDIAALDWDTRLLFIGLWSYVDDNGVGRDVEQLIVAQLFPLESDPREALAKVSRGLRALSDGGQVTRYVVAGKPFLFINAWEKHQKIDRPNNARYEPPTSANAIIREILATPSRGLLADVASGAVDQRSRGTEEPVLKTPSPQAASAFDEFWASYPRKVQKADARKAFAKAAKAVSVATIIAGAQRYSSDPNLPEVQYIPHPSKWLNGGGWDDEPCAPRPINNGRPTTDDKIANTFALGARLAAREHNPYRLEITG